MSEQEKSLSEIFPRGERFNNPNFSGDVWLHMLVPAGAPYHCPVGNVTFAPGCRNSWHVHPGGQILLIMSGEGWYQEEGKPAQPLRPGDVVTVPAGVRHWHGATKSSPLSHLSIETNAQAGAVDWQEPVADADYDALS